MHQATLEVTILVALTVCILVDSGDVLEGYFASAAFVRSLASHALQLVTDPAPHSQYVDRSPLCARIRALPFRRRRVTPRAAVI